MVHYHSQWVVQKTMLQLQSTSVILSSSKTPKHPKLKIQHGFLDTEDCILMENVGFKYGDFWIFQGCLHSYDFCFHDTQGIDHADQSSRTSPRSGLHRGGAVPQMTKRTPVQCWLKKAWLESGDSTTTCLLFSCLKDQNKRRESKWYGMANMTDMVHGGQPVFRRIQNSRCGIQNACC